MRSSRGSRLLRGPPQGLLPNSLLSAPATKVRPPPITTAALTAGSPLISSIAARTPSATPGLRAFTGGLSMVMTETSLSLLILTRLFIGLSCKIQIQRNIHKEFLATRPSGLHRQPARAPSRTPKRPMPETPLPLSDRDRRQSGPAVSSPTGNLYGAR